MECFNQQIRAYKAVTADIYDQIMYKRVWSGDMIQVGDKVLYAFVFDPTDDALKLISVLDRELGLIQNTFDFVAFKNKIIPVLKFKTDAKNRQYTEQED
jgi:hypothetical protein